MRKTILALAILSGLSGRFIAERQALLCCDLSERLWGHEAGHKALVYWNLTILKNYGCSPRLSLALARDEEDPLVSVVVLTIQRNACRDYAASWELAEVEKTLAGYEALVDPAPNTGPTNF